MTDINKTHDDNLVEENPQEEEVETSSEEVEIEEEVETSSDESNDSSSGKTVDDLEENLKIDCIIKKYVYEYLNAQKDLLMAQLVNQLMDEKSKWEKKYGSKQE